MSTSSDHGRIYAAATPQEQGLATFARAVVRPVSSFAGWTTHRAVGFTRRGSHAVQGRVGRVSVIESTAGERRRIAADVHDLVMQDLSIALSTARMLVDDPASAPHAKVVVEAGERALAGARELVNGLTREERPEPIAQVVEANVRTAARTAPLDFQAIGVDPGEEPDRLTAHTLLHVAREAVTNAIKHSGPDTPVEVCFARDDEWRLTVRDRGRGFDLAHAPRGFGLESMHARACELGGMLHVISAPGEGSTVELVLP